MKSKRVTVFVPETACDLYKEYADLLNRQVPGARLTQASVMTNVLLGILSSADIEKTLGKTMVEKEQRS